MQKPSIGRIVIYRNQDGQGIPGIITEVLEDVPWVPDAFAAGGDRVNVHLFVPPSARQDPMSPEYGIPFSEEPASGCWSWPERV